MINFVGWYNQGSFAHVSMVLVSNDFCFQPSHLRTRRDTLKAEYIRRLTTNGTNLISTTPLLIDCGRFSFFYEERLINLSGNERGITPLKSLEHRLWWSQPTARILKWRINPGHVLQQTQKATNACDQRTSCKRSIATLESVPSRTAR